jgi:hypothetical protein
MELANIDRINGAYAHPTKPGLVTIPERATLAMPLLKSILRQAKSSNEEFMRLIHKGGER